LCNELTFVSCFYAKVDQRLKRETFGDYGHDHTYDVIPAAGWKQVLYTAEK